MLQKNGEDFLEEIKKDLNLSVGLVNQNLEAKIGFNTALAHLNLLEKQEKIEEENVLVWDSGGGSFQIADKEGPVFMGQLGSSVVTSYLAKIKNKAINEILNPISEEEEEKLNKKITLELSKLQVNEEKINSSKSLISIGEHVSAFAILKRVREVFNEAEIKDENSFTLEETEALIKKCLNKSKQFFEENKVDQTEMVVPKLCLLKCVLTKLNIKEFKYLPTTGGCSGFILLKLREEV